MNFPFLKTHLRNAESGVDVELVDERIRMNHFEDDVRHFDEVLADEVALV